MGIKISKEEIKLDTQDSDYDHKAVRRLIRVGRLAPLYTGLSEEVLPSETAVECPICFYYYNAINYSRCCNQPICTNCFLRLKRSPKHPLLSAVCPFCVQPDFGIVYIPSPFSHEYQLLSTRRKSLVDRRLDNPRRRLGFNDPHVVLVDEVRPDWHKMVERKQGLPRGMSGSGTTRRTVVRPNGATPIVNRVRASGSAYYANTTTMGHTAEWQNDEVTVINAIRKSAAQGSLVQAAA